MSVSGERVGVVGVSISVGCLPRQRGERIGDLVRSPRYADGPFSTQRTKLEPKFTDDAATGAGGAWPPLLPPEGRAHHTLSELCTAVPAAWPIEDGPAHLQTPEVGHSSVLRKRSSRARWHSKYRIMGETLTSEDGLASPRNAADYSC